jgi:aminoglycoside phosphotransferase (APT) family kinase protein
MDVEVAAILLRAFPGCKVESSEELQGGISCRTVAARLLQADGSARRVVVRRPHRRNPEDTLRVLSSEHRVLSSCARLGICAPRPCFIDPAGSALVLEYVEGAPDFAPREASDMLRQLATQLAQIHQAEPDAELRLLQHRNESAGRDIERRPEHFDEHLDERGIRAQLLGLWPWSQHNPDRLLHGDYWPGNVLWRDGKLVSVLDWEESELGDPLADIALARLDLLWAFGADAMEQFTSCYREQSNLDWRNLARWELCVALRPMSSLDRWAMSFVAPPISRPDVTEQVMRQAHQRFVALARLRIAAEEPS